MQQLRDFSKPEIDEGKSRLLPVSQPDQKTEARALAKGLEILDYLRERGAPASLTGLSEVAGLGKPSTLRILKTLQAAGWLTRDANDDYCLDRDWPARSSRSWLRNLTAAALLEMRKLNAESAETVTLAALFEDHIRVVEVLDSPQIIRMANYKSRILPPYASSLGKAITAFQTPDKIELLLQTYGAYRFTEKTSTDPRAIRRDLAETRERGFSCDDEETVMGGVCFGAPVQAGAGPVLAAISVSTPRQRLSGEARAATPKAVVAAAAAISRAIGS